MKLSTSRFGVAFAAVITLALAGCGGVKTSDTSTDDATEIVIGASIPISGPLASFGSFQKFGYEQAVKEVNDAGGIEVGGKMLKVQLKLLDDKTDPNTVSSNIDSLVSGDQAHALLGSCTPALVIPGAIAAERAKIPFVTACESPWVGWSLHRLETRMDSCRRTPPRGSRPRVATAPTRRPLRCGWSGLCAQS